LEQIQSQSFRIASSYKNVCPVIGKVLCFLEKEIGELSECSRFETKVILNELIANAVRHGNRCMEDKEVEIMAAVDGNKAIFTITDEGSGFDCSDVLNLVSSEKGKTPSDTNETGRGILIVKTLSDSVEYNKQGNSVTVVKSLDNNTM
jgi:serine/threonine-protein kinase RsbW